MTGAGGMGFHRYGQGRSIPVPAKVVSINGNITGSGSSNVTNLKFFKSKLKT